MQAEYATSLTSRLHRTFICRSSGARRIPYSEINSQARISVFNYVSHLFSFGASWKSKREENVSHFIQSRLFYIFLNVSSWLHSHEDLENDYLQSSSTFGWKYGKRILHTKLSYGALRQAHSPRCGYVVYLHHNVATKVAVNRPAVVMHSQLARTAAADGKANDCNNCSLSFPFRTKALCEQERTSPRSTCERARRKLGNPVNSLCMAIQVQSRSKRSRTRCATSLQNKFRLQCLKSNRIKDATRYIKYSKRYFLLRFFAECPITRIIQMFVDKRNGIYFKS